METFLGLCDDSRAYSSRNHTVSISISIINNSNINNNNYNNNNNNYNNNNDNNDNNNNNNNKDYNRQNNSQAKQLTGESTHLIWAQRLAVKPRAKRLRSKRPGESTHGRNDTRTKRPRIKQTHLIYRFFKQKYYEKLIFLVNFFFFFYIFLFLLKT